MRPSIFSLSLAGAVLVGSACAVAQDTTVEARLAQMTQRAQSLHRAAQLLRDEKSIEKLQRGYGYYVDKKMWSQVADLFAEDATYEIGQRGVYVGKTRIRQALELWGPEGIKDGELFNHLQLQPVIHVAADGNTAKARWRAITMTGHFGKDAFWGEGVYENEYVKVNGVWKIRTFHYYPTFVTPYDKGWGKEVISMAVKAPPGFEPDRPPTLKYESYPKYFVPPFHYPNPVTGKPAQIGTAEDAGAKQ